MTSWLSVEGTPWCPLTQGDQEILEFRRAHLGPPREPPAVVAGPLFIVLHPSDGGPPCRLRDLQLFQVWAERRRVGPRPGVELALELFGHTPAVWGEDSPFDEYSPSVWRRAVWGVRGMSHGLATIAGVAGNAGAEGRLGVAHTEDLVWFLARAAFIITWMDTDRIDREDTTMVLPVMPLCLEAIKMATRCICLGMGVPTKVVWTLTETMFAAVTEVGGATARDCLYCDIHEDLPSDEENHPTPLF